MDSVKETIARPFLKWAGGKRQLLPILLSHLPDMGAIEHYWEPFIGGGAMLWKVAQSYPHLSRSINDVNLNLVIAYATLKANPQQLIDELDSRQTGYYSLGEEERETYYLTARKQFNLLRGELRFKFSENWVPHAANMIFLNRTCFNGLYRENLKGQFNVPFGRLKKPVICDRSNLMACHEVLRSTLIHRGNFRLVEDRIQDNAFVYLDPPYRPLSTTASFCSYSAKGFNDKHQIELKEMCDRLHQRGVKFMLSNSDPHNTDPDDHFFDDLYQDYRVIRVPARRAINSKGSSRGLINELLILNY